jgi:nucleoside-diphosphate-sugar epimerase
LTEQVLVTGASGFIGYHLVRALVEDGYEVTCLVRPTSDLSALAPFNVSFVEGDVTQLDSLLVPVRSVTTVFHLAASTASFSSDMQKQVNEGGVRNVAEACAASDNVPKLILVSSSAAAGPSPPDRPMRETDPPSPISNYGRSKLAGENVARQWGGQVPITIIRPAIVFGEYDQDVLRMFQLVSRGWHLVPGLGTRYFSLIHAADVAKALILAASKGENLPSPKGSSSSSVQGIYFIADDLAPSYADLGRMMAKALDRKIRVVNIPGAFIWGLALVYEVLNRIQGKPSIMNLDKAREGLTGSWVYSSEKAKAQLEFKPGATLQDRIHQTGVWYQEQGWL